MPREHIHPHARPQNVSVGLAGWSYKDWNGILYPHSRPQDFHELAYVADFFDVAEINTSFYQPLRPSTVFRWIDFVANHSRFRFTAKLWRKFTHETDATSEDEKLVREGFDALQQAGKLGAVLLQFPFSFHNTPENMERLESLLAKFHAYPLVVEVRHSSWGQEEFYHRLHERGVGFCNIDQPVIGRSVKPLQQITSRVGYVRLHGRRYDTWFSDDPEVPREERYNYLYSQEELKPWAERVEKIASRTDTTFVIANNHFEAKAAVNALELIHLLSGAKVKIPEPLRQHYPRLDAIADGPTKEPTLFPLMPK